MNNEGGKLLVNSAKRRVEGKGGVVAVGIRIQSSFTNRTW